MSILEDGVLSSTSYHGRGMFRFDRIGYKNKMLLKEITPRQRNKFKYDRLIPCKVLQVLWNLGYLPGEKQPQEGMRVKAFLKFLRNGQYLNEKNNARGVWLHDKIEQEEFPPGELSSEILIIDEGGKFVPISYLKRIPGTIFR